MSPELELSVMSWNLFGAPVAPEPEFRMQRVAAMARAARYDLALFQEVWTEDQSAAILRELGADYDSRTSGSPRTLVGRKGGLMALLRKDSQWRFAADHFHEFDGEASELYFWQADGLADKGIQQIALARREELEPLDIQVLHTHLQSGYAPRALFHFDGVRATQLQELEALASTLDLVPVLAFGDLNLAPSSANYASLTDYWQDLTVAERARCGCGTHDGVAGGDADWIDYALARPSASWQVEADIRRLERNDSLGMLSDHNGLAARIRFRSVSEANRDVDPSLDVHPNPGARPSLDVLASAALAGPSSRRAWLLSAGYLLGRLLLPGLGLRP